jgi:hypothetical protein
MYLTKFGMLITKRQPESCETDISFVIPYLMLCKTYEV